MTFNKMSQRASIDTMSRDHGIEFTRRTLGEKNTYIMK